MKPNARVAILMSTYNGEAYLSELLESLHRQTFQDWTLIVRDDRSQDSTPQLLERHAAHDPRVQIHDRIKANIGIVKSFGILLASALDYDYVFFCDQDDIWVDTKLAVFIAEFERFEAANSPLVPVAIHCDLEVMGADGRFISKSFRRAAGLPRESPQLQTNYWPLLGRNFITGCALALNRPLVRLTVPIAKDALMHDWWAALIAASLGKIVSIDQALVRYRQHSNNASGALSEFGLINKLKRRLLNAGYFKALMERRFRQSMALEQHLRALGESQKADRLREFHLQIAQGRVSAVLAANNKRIRLFSIPRTLLYYAMLFFYQPRIAKMIKLQSSLQRST